MQSSLIIPGRIPNAVILPEAKAKMLYGIDPVVFTRADMTSGIAWYKFAAQHDAYLEEHDFVKKDKFYQYFLLSLGLLEYPVVIISGDPGAGKSLIMGYLTYQIARLFKKKIVLDWTPPEPKLFGSFYSLNDQDVIDKIQLESNRLEKEEKERKLRGEGKLPVELMQNFLVYNAILGLDEGDKWAPNTSRTNTNKLISRLANRRRHFFLGLLMVYIRPERADLLIKESVTHTITCGHDWFPSLPGYCSYQIRDCRPGGTGITKWLHLNPSNCTRIWDSHNAVGMSHTLDVNLGGRKRPEHEKGNSNSN